jgi:hypothetical protein
MDTRREEINVCEAGDGESLEACDFWRLVAA